MDCSCAAALDILWARGCDAIRTGSIFAATKKRRPRFLGADQIWAPTAPCDDFSIGHPNLQSSYFCREAIPASLPTEPALGNPSVDPTGFEPASATVAGCCVAVTPRARLTA